MAWYDIWTGRVGWSMAARPSREGALFSIFYALFSDASADAFLYEQWCKEEEEDETEEFSLN